MRSRFISRLVSTPWHIGPTAGRTIIASFLADLMRAERPAVDYDGAALPKMRVEGDCAIIPIMGVIMLGVPDWVKKYGFNLTDPNDIEEEYNQALADPAVRMIMLDVDSPGGESIGGEKLYELAASAGKKKPVFAHVGDGCMMCSSAYQASAPATAIYAGRFSDIGCIGTYLAYIDDSAYWEAMGIKFETFRSGLLKGIDGALTDDQRAYFAASVAEYGARFRSGVLRYRTSIAFADMEGQSFRGIEGVQKGFAAGHAKNLADAITKASKLVA